MPALFRIARNTRSSVSPAGYLTAGALMSVIIVALVFRQRLIGVGRSAYDWVGPKDASERISLLTSLSTTVGAIFFFGSLIVAWRTWRTAQEGQIAERFTRAIDQLGVIDESGAIKIEIRMGAIHALERLMQSSPQEQWTVIDIMASYLRQHAPRLASETSCISTPFSADVQNLPQLRDALASMRETISQGSALLQEIRNRTAEVGALRGYLTFDELDAAQKSEEEMESFLKRLEPLSARYQSLSWQTDPPPLRGDIRAILEVVRRRKDVVPSQRRSEIDLRNWLDFRRTRLEGGDFRMASLNGARFNGADVTGANFGDASLEGVEFDYGILSYANLAGARLKGASFHGTVMLGTNLQRTDLRQVLGLELTALEGAVFDQSTRLPKEMEAKAIQYRLGAGSAVR